jgi:hypothetical protein
LLVLPYLLCPYEPVVFPVDFDGGGYVYRVNPINVQLVTDTVTMPAKEEHGCDSGSESLDKQEPRDILHCHVEIRESGLRARSPAVGPILKQRHRTVRLASARSHRCWRLRSWQHILLSDES